MMEPFYPSPYRKPLLPVKDWILDGCEGRAPRVIKSLYMGDGELEMRNSVLQMKYNKMKNREVKSDGYYLDDAEIILVAFGIAARIALSAVLKLRREGLKVGLFRPVTLFPFPEQELSAIAGENVRFLTIEMNAGQMVEDVRLSVNGKSEVLFYGRPGGSIITPEEIEEKIRQVCCSTPCLIKAAFHRRDARDSSLL
jgi:2-oxoglutarate ferredoxin oxidoreductase subunit alpha